MAAQNTGWPSEGESSIPEDVLTIAKFLRAID